MTIMSAGAKETALDDDETEPDSPDTGFILDVELQDVRWRDYAQRLTVHGRFLHHALALPACEMSLLLTNDAAMCGLNARYRDRQETTNVLSFPALDFAAPAQPGGFPSPPAPVLLGDVVMAYECVAHETRAHGVPLGDHAMHLLTHGLLHLLGHDHQSAAQAVRMEALEIDLLMQCGIANPYETNPYEAEA